jgi:hypothetical protein
MEALSAADLLALWERGSAADAHERALLLLGAARPDVPAARLGAVPLAARDAELLRLRRATFGERLAATVGCPACGEALELELAADAIQPEVDAGTIFDPVRVAAAGTELAIRPPTTDDLVALAAAAMDIGDADAARRTLACRLVGSDSADGPAPPWPEVEAAVEKALAEDGADPDLVIEVRCPACAHAWEARLDTADFLWAEVLAGARRVADEVAGLAAAYGWREADVLALSPWRRRLYLDLAAG